MPATAAKKYAKKSFDKADEVRPFQNGRLDIVTLHGHSIGRATFDPGWVWSKSIKPIAQTELCEAEHLGCVIRGRMRIKMQDGTEVEYGPGDAMFVEPGHDAWVVGSEPCIVFDFVGYKDYALPNKPGVFGR